MTIKMRTDKRPRQTVFLIVVLGGSCIGAYLAPPRWAEGEEQTCKKTVAAGPCGANLNLYPVACSTGQPTCYFEITSFGLLMNCEVSQSGLKSCEVRQCKKTTFTQKCEGGHCVFDGEPKVEDAGVPITIATGVSCSPVTDPDPGGGGVGG